MKILMLSWRDSKNPLAGGAEEYTYQVLRGLVKLGNDCTWFCSSFKDAKPEEIVDGIKVVRKGNGLGVYMHGLFYAWRNQAHFDRIVDEVNTIPFFTPLIVPQKKRIALFFQLCEEVWFWEVNPVIGHIGRTLENIYLRLYSSTKTIAMSRSTKLCLAKYGIKKVSIVLPGINFKPVTHTSAKNPHQLCFVGRLKKSKRVIDAIRAIEIAKANIPKIKLVIIGTGDKDYESFLRKYVKNNDLTNNVVFAGRISFNKRNAIMGESQAIIVTSVKEGWGLIITEANANGTTAIGYDVDGIRDAIKNNQTGLLSAPSPIDLSVKIIQLLKSDNLRKKLNKQAILDSKRYTWGKTVAGFKNIFGC